MTHLLALVLTITPPPPSQAYVELRSHGASQGFVRVVNCSGSGITCAADGGLGTLTVAGSTSDGGFGLLSAACPSPQYAKAIDGGGLVCGVPAGTCGGGSNPQVQYNNSGSCGGIVNFQTDGTRPSVVAEGSHPAAPGGDGLMYDYVAQGRWPQLPYRIDSYTGFPTAPGTFTSSGVYMPVPGSMVTWLANCHYPDAWASSTFSNPAQTGNGLSVTASSTGGNGWDAGTWWGQQRWCHASSSSAANSVIDGHMQSKHSALPTVSSSGGFVWYARVSIELVYSSSRWFFGLNNTVNALAGAAEPSAYTYTIYYGCDPADSNLHVYSNDGSGSASVHADLGEGFPCKTNGVTYDLWFAVPPGGGTVSYFAQRLNDYNDTTNGNTASGTFSTDLPNPGEQLATHVFGGNADAGRAIQLGVGPTCTWDNW